MLRLQILLCDECDAGFHTACLRPPLMLIPDGDWFCPNCEHVSPPSVYPPLHCDVMLMLCDVTLQHRLIASLTLRLEQLSSALKKKDSLLRRHQRLKFVGISLDNILPDSDGEAAAGAHRKHKRRVVASSESDEDHNDDTTVENANATEPADAVVPCLLTSRDKRSMSDVIKRNRAVSSGDELIDDEVSRK